MGGPWSAGQPARIRLVIVGINAPHQRTRWLEGSSHPTDNSPISYPRRQVWAGVDDHRKSPVSINEIHS